MKYRVQKLARSVRNDDVLLKVTVAKSPQDAILRHDFAVIEYFSLGLLYNELRVRAESLESTREAQEVLEAPTRATVESNCSEQL